MKTEPRVDAYIEKAAEFARPILVRLRALVHEALPDVEETIKWSMPFFVKGKTPICFMAAFKQHCGFGYWKGAQVVDGGGSNEAMGQLGRITGLADLPAKKTLIGQIRRAAALAEARTAAPSARKVPAAKKAPPVVPDDLAAALKKNAKARKTFESFSASQQREYVEWISEAKRAETRARRLATTLEWLAEGKPRNWKYMNC